MDNLTIALALTAAFGFLVVVICINGIYKGYCSMQWPTTTARIVEASIRDDHGADRKFYPHITFTFEYENNTYTSNALFASGVVTYFQSLQAAQTFMAPYAKDNKVFVSICPHDPTQSILIAGIQKRFYAGLILGGYFMWLSINRLGF